MKSEFIKELAKALSKAQGAFDHAKKDVANAFFKSKYADLASCIDAAKQHLTDNGLAVTQVVDYDENGLMFLETTLMHSSGEWISGKYPINPIKSDPQSIGSAISYARRYAFCAITGIAADDDDGNAASQPANKKQAANQSINESSKEPEYADKLRKATNMQELIATWQVVPKSLHRSLAGVKDEMKAKLQPEQDAA